jgi:hypothetical protein
VEVDQEEAVRFKARNKSIENIKETEQVYHKVEEILT